MKTTPSHSASNPQHSVSNRAKMSFRSGLLAIIACLLGATAVHADDTFATAIAIQPGEVSGAISPVNDVDYFKFTLTSPQMVTIAAKASAVGTVLPDMLIRLYNSGENQIVTGGTGQTQSITQFLQTGIYFVSAETWTTTGPYKLVLKTQSSATPMAKVTLGNLDVPNDWETYKFTVGSPGRVVLQVRKPRISTPAINLTMIVRDEAGNSTSSTGSAANFDDFLNPGIYFVTITSEYSGDFSLKLTTPDNAVAISDGITHVDIDVPLDHDYYRFVVPGNTQRTIRIVISGSVYIRPTLQNEFGQSPTRFDPSQNHDREITLEPGIYFLMLYGYYEYGTGSYGNYTLALSGIIPTFPEISVQEPKGRDLVDGKSKFSFGSSIIGKGKGITKTFVIRNTGTGTLVGIKVASLGKNAADFKIKTQPASSLAAGKQTTFKVTFKPKAKGRKSASLRIASNDADENPFDISLTGKGSKK